MEDWKKHAAENAKNAMLEKTNPAPPDNDTNGVALEFYAPVHVPSAWSCGDKPTDPQELAIWNEVRETLKTVPVPAEVYPDISWEVFASSYNPKAKLWPFIDKQGGVHTISLEDFENHPTVVALKNRTDPVMIKTLNFKARKGWPDISREQAYMNNKAFDPTGATPTATRVIPRAPPSSGGSSSSDAALPPAQRQRRW